MAREIELTQGYVTIVDNEDYEWLLQWKWHVGVYSVRKTPYACRTDNKVKLVIHMHRLIINAPKGIMVDHINGNTLDNRKENLRLATNRENQRNRGKPSNNSSGYKGITWHKRDNYWQVTIIVDCNRIYIGSFKSLDDAIAARNEAYLKYHGEFANIN